MDRLIFETPTRARIPLPPQRSYYSWKRPAHLLYTDQHLRSRMHVNLFPDPLAFDRLIVLIGEQQG